jgi:hypothetical protein
VGLARVQAKVWPPRTLGDRHCAGYWARRSCVFDSGGSPILCCKKGQHGEQRAPFGVRRDCRRRRRGCGDTGSTARVAGPGRTDKSFTKINRIVVARSRRVSPESARQLHAGLANLGSHDQGWHS